MIYILGLLLLYLLLILVFGHEQEEHPWKYRNPFDRTCPICGRNEQEECWGEDFERHGFAAHGTWVVYREGDPTKHLTKH